MSLFSRSSKNGVAENSAELQNAAKTLFANIKFMSPDKPLKKIMLTSSVPNEGKSTTAIELAKAIASSGNTVLLVETDMRRRSLANMLKIRPQAAGMYAALTGRVPLNQAIVSTYTTNLYFLDVEPSIPNPVDVLSSQRYRGLVEALSENYDYLIFDTPPVGTFIDAAILSTLVDGVIMTVRVQSTKRADLLDAYEQLKRAGANIIGSCATFVEVTRSNYYYYYYYYNEDGKRVKRRKSSSSASHNPADSGGFERLDDQPFSPAMPNYRSDQPRTHDSVSNYTASKYTDGGSKSKHAGAAGKKAVK